MAKEKPLTTGEAARSLHVTSMAVLKWIRAGKLNAYRVPGGHYRIEREEFLRFLKENQMPIPKELFPQEPPQILVVDDEPAIRESLQLILAQDGYEVAVAADGEEAVEAVRKRRYDLIFLDVLLPRVSGPEVFKVIRERDPKAMVVLITAYSDHPQALEALELGPAMLLRKPFRIQEIRDVVQIVFKE